MQKVAALLLAAVMVMSAVTGCSKGLSEEEQTQLKADIVESTEHAMILNEFIAYMFGVDETGESGLIGGGQQFNTTTELLRVNNYLEYDDHIDIVKNERNDIVEVYEKAGGNVPDDIKKMYDNYIIITDLAFDPANEEDSVEVFVKEYTEAKELAEEIYETGETDENG